MNLLNSRKQISAAALTTTILSGVILGNSVPAAAVMFSFCGDFVDGGKVDGKIDVDLDGSFDSTRFAKITATRAGGQNPRMYTGTDFNEDIGVEIVTHPTKGVESFRYNFRFDNLSFPDDKFQVYLPKSIFPIEEGAPPPELPEVFPQFEMREGVQREDIDKVPEPLTTLGSVVLLGAGAVLKREHSKQQKKA